MSVMRRIFAAAFLFAQPFGLSGSTGGTAPVSPSVMATDMCKVDANGRGTLELLVLWRGGPRWFKKGDGGGSGGGGTMSPDSKAVQSAWVSQGGVSLHVRFDSAARKAWVQDNEIDLGDANVILVDDVDSAAGPRVVRTLRIDPDYETKPRMPVPAQTFIRRSPELVEFLRCDARPPDASAYERKVFDMWCALVN